MGVTLPEALQERDRRDLLCRGELGPAQLGKSVRTRSRALDHALGRDDEVDVDVVRA
jgi:NADH/NAD ratio-sensing transcriptional regulator Rex